MARASHEVIALCLIKHKAGMSKTADVIMKIPIPTEQKMLRMCVWASLKEGALLDQLLFVTDTVSSSAGLPLHVCIQCVAREAGAEALG